MASTSTVEAAPARSMWLLSLVMTAMPVAFRRVCEATNDSSRRNGGCPEFRGSWVAARCRSGDVGSVVGVFDVLRDVVVEGAAEGGEVEVAVDASELFRGFGHAGGAPAQRHGPVTPALDVR